MGVIGSERMIDKKWQFNLKNSAFGVVVDHAHAATPVTIMAKKEMANSAPNSQFESDFLIAGFLEEVACGI